MKRSIIAMVAIGFILWIMPLGLFIKPSQQKLACDGQRAICMCHALVPKPDKSIDVGAGLKSGSSTNKENPSGASNYFVSAKPMPALNLPSMSLFENPSLVYQSPFLLSLEHVPKF